jgi:hypothetical protein
VSWFDTIIGRAISGFVGAQGTSGANAPITVTLAASSGNRHHVVEVIASYSGTPTGGRLTSTGLAGDQLDVDITASGPAPIGFPPVTGLGSGAVTFTLAAGGAGVVGKLTVLYATTRY